MHIVISYWQLTRGLTDKYFNKTRSLWPVMRVWKSLLGQNLRNLTSQHVVSGILISDKKSYFSSDKKVLETEIKCLSTWIIWTNILLKQRVISVPWGGGQQSETVSNIRMMIIGIKWRGNYFHMISSHLRKFSNVIIPSECTGPNHLKSLKVTVMHPCPSPKEKLKKVSKLLKI